MQPRGLSADGVVIARRRIRRVGLISPTSGNLGNAAMQTAMIANLRTRIAGVEILGITLNPDETRRRHGIKAFPLAGVSRPYYGLFNSANSKTPHRQTPKISLIKQWLKRVPPLRSGWRALRACSMELAHITAAARLVRKLDRVIIPGGGALDDFWGGPWGQPWALFKWSLLSRLHRVPFLFVSIGKCSLERPASRFFVRVALRLAEYRSYRDHDSKIAVQTLIDARNDPVYPDLAFSYPCSTVPTARGDGSQDKRLVVGVSPIAYCDPRAWPRQDERRYAAYIGQLAEMVKWLIKEHYRVLFFTTDSPDSATVDDVQAMISGSEIETDTIQTLPGSTEQSPDSLLKGISCADLVIASRLHGVILSHLNLTPVLALSFDRKVDAHMNAVGQESYCLNIDHLRLDRLIECFTALKAARQREQACLRSAALRFRHLLDLQYDWIVGTPRFSRVAGNCLNQIDASPLAEIGGFRTR
jgi:polysaccharide pyruvyl transferase WcaK-like protein